MKVSGPSTILSCILAAAIILPGSQALADIKVKGKIYGNWAMSLDDDADSYNAFNVTRAYVTVKSDINESFATRVTTDIGLVKGSDDTKLRSFLKYAYLEWKDRSTDSRSDLVPPEPDSLGYMTNSLDDVGLKSLSPTEQKSSHLLISVFTRWVSMLMACSPTKHPSSMAKAMVKSKTEKIRLPSFALLSIRSQAVTCLYQSVHSFPTVLELRKPTL